MARYTSEFTIPYYDCSGEGTVRPESLLAYMGETSALHSDYLGVGGADLVEKGFVWMLNRWRVRFIKYPKARDIIKVETWSSGIDRFYATREFNIYDNHGNLMVQASTQWVFLDIHRKRPTRVPDDMNNIYDTESEYNLHDFYEFKKEIDINKEVDFHVRKSDIDSNNHVNNVKYLNWMIEALPDELDDKYLYELDIQYKKETKLGNLIISGVSIDKQDEEIICYHKITGKDDLHAFGRSIWTEKNPL